MERKDTTNNQKATLSLKEASIILGVDPRTLSEGCRSGKIPSIQLGRRWLVLTQPLFAILNGGDKNG